MTQVSILQNPNGSLIVVHFAPGKERDIERVRRESFPTAMIVGLIDGESLPSWKFRDCWRLNGPAVAIDMPLAREQRIAEIRVERNTRLAELDGPWMRAMGQRLLAEADTIEAKRQQLRDMPTTIAPALAACLTADALEALTPNWPTL